MLTTFETDFSLYPKLAEGLSGPLEYGRPLYELIVPKRPIIDDLSHVPDAAQFVATSGKAKGLERLRELEQLVALWASPASIELFRECARAPGLRALYVARFKDISDVPLAGANQLEHLLLSWATRLVDLSFLNELPALRTLYIDDMKRLDLDTLPDLPRLTGLAIGGGIWSTMKVASLAPLTRLPNLRYLRIISLKGVDGSLQPLSELRRLEELSLPNYWPMEEFARLSGALPATRSNVATPFFASTHGGDPIRINTACKTCGGTRTMMTGRPSAYLCPKCHRSRLDRRIANWELARASGWRP